LSPSVSIAVAFEDVADAPNSRLYFSRALLTNATYEKVNRNDQRVSKLAQQLLEIPGVTGALIAPYDVHVMKAALYSETPQ
jgi:hypothetical protein